MNELSGSHDMYTHVKGHGPGCPERCRGSGDGSEHAAAAAVCEAALIRVVWPKRLPVVCQKNTSLISNGLIQCFYCGLCFLINGFFNLSRGEITPPPPATLKKED